MVNAWQPRLVKADLPSPVETSAPRDPVATVVHTIERVVEKAAVDAMPPSWRFVPVRDDSNLIVEIIATPFK